MSPTQRNSFSYQYNPTRVHPAHDDVHYAEDDAVADGGHDAVFYPDEDKEEKDAKVEDVKGTTEDAKEAKAGDKDVSATAAKPEAAPAADKLDEATRVTVKVVS